MEAIFEKNPYPDLDIREILSQEFGVPESKIQVWFQNRRTRRGRTKSRRGPYTTKQTISKHPYTHVIQPLAFTNTLPWFQAPSAMLPSLIPRCSPSADYWIPSRTSDHHPNGQQQDKLRELLIGELRTYESTASDDDPHQTSDMC
ncbi:homeobox protein OTX2-A-like [Haliotis cracherodii]|uniref:homeobox protein OTX2-A-like n=1 Tax=Haliotis cracherodii TaxID=6455 RepID=UPI0039ED3B05